MIQPGANFYNSAFTQDSRHSVRTRSSDGSTFSKSLEQTGHESSVAGESFSPTDGQTSGNPLQQVLYFVDLADVRARCLARGLMTLETARASTVYSNCDSRREVVERIEDGQKKMTAWDRPLSITGGAPDLTHPATDHSKTFSVDGGWIILGSPNH